MSTIIEITDASVFTTHVSSLSSTTLLAISFHTPWAAPCVQMALILETLASSYPPETPPTVSFLSINAESFPDISESYDVTAVPFLVLQKDGKVLESISGSDASKVRDAVERHAGKGASKDKPSLPPALEATPRVNGEGERTAKKGSDSQAPQRGSDATPARDSSPNEGHTNDLYSRLADLVKAAPVMLFMKGTPSAPQCGFSRQMVGLLRERGVQYGFFNILADEDVRQGLKEFS